MTPKIRQSAARAFCNLAALVLPHQPLLAERLLESAAKVLAGQEPIWDEAEELQRQYLVDN